MRPSHMAPVLTRKACRAAVWLAGLLFVATALALNLYAWTILAAEGSPSSSIEVTIQRGVLNLKVRDAPLADVLRAIAEQAGFRVVIDGDLSTAITWSFSGVTVDKGVQRLLQYAAPSWLMIYAPSRGQAGPGSLAVVRVYTSARKSATADPAEDRAARLRAVETMARQPGATDGDSLVRFLAQDEDPVIRSIAAIGLGRLGGERALAALATALADEDNSVRRRAIQGLTTIGGDRAIRAMGEALMEDADPRNRLLAAGTLGGMPGREALKALQAAVSDPDPMVRQAAELAVAGKYAATRRPQSRER